MPVIYRLLGIIIKMNPIQKEHNPPHIHAIYGEAEALFDINTSRKTKGSFPKKQEMIVKEFINYHKDELLKMWETNQIYKLED